MATYTSLLWQQRRLTVATHMTQCHAARCQKRTVRPRNKSPAIRVPQHALRGPQQSARGHASYAPGRPALPAAFEPAAAPRGIGEPSDRAHARSSGAHDRGPCRRERRSVLPRAAAGARLPSVEVPRSDPRLARPAARHERPHGGKCACRRCGQVFPGGCSTVQYFASCVSGPQTLL